LALFFALSVRHITLEFISPVPPRFLPELTNADLLDRITTLGINLDAIAFRKYKKEVHGKINKLSILRNDVLPKPVHVHAEVQLAMFLITYKPDSDTHTHVENCKYIGCSKKSCYLCSQFLHGLYRTRGSHGKVYHQWTLPAIQGLELLAALKLHARIAAMGNHMRETLLRPGTAKRPTVSESTETVTTTSQAVKGKWKRELRQQRVTLTSMEICYMKM
jgi:hypothetical protein